MLNRKNELEDDLSTMQSIENLNSRIEKIEQSDSDLKLISEQQPIGLSSPASSQLA